jgi:hypothetical protein
MTHGKKSEVMKTPLEQPSIARRLLVSVHAVQRNAGRLLKGPTSGMKTDILADGIPVIFIHNPRTGGRSLEAFFNIRRLSHAFPIERLSEKHWRESFVVTSVRHPLDRFFRGTLDLCERLERIRLLNCMAGE